MPPHAGENITSYGPLISIPAIVVDQPFEMLREMSARHFFGNVWILAAVRKIEHDWRIWRFPVMLLFESLSP